MSDAIEVAKWMQAFGQDVPSAPCIPHEKIRKLRGALCLEETLELCISMGLSGVQMKDGKWVNFQWVIDALKSNPVWAECPVDFVGVQDACADSRVVVAGTEVAFGLNGDENFAEAMRSNWTKFWTDEEVWAEFVPTDKELPNTLEEFKECRVGSFYYLRGDKTARKVVSSERCWIVKGANAKVLKSPSYSEAKFKPLA